MSKKDEYFAMMESQIKKWDAEVDKLRAKSDQASAEARAKFSEQLVDGLVLMGNGLRAGFTLLQAIDMLVEEMPAPISQEFDLVRREYRVGVDLDQALLRQLRQRRGRWCPPASPIF